MGETEIRRTSHGRRHKVRVSGAVRLQAGGTRSEKPPPCLCHLAVLPATEHSRALQRAAVAGRGVLHWLSWQRAPHHPGGGSQNLAIPGRPPSHLALHPPTPPPLHSGRVPCSLVSPMPWHPSQTAPAQPSG